MTEKEKESLYTEALELKKTGKYEETLRAYKRFIELENYKDSEALANECKDFVDKADEFVGKVYRKKKTIKNVIVAVMITAAVLALGFVTYKTVIVRELTYREAVALFDKGDFDNARPIFESLGKYKNSATYMKDCSQQTEIAVGNTIYFGSFEQDNDGKNEYIEWIILDIQENKALLVSRYALYNYMFDDNSQDSPWENSLLRTWLNVDFLSKAFNREERLKIINTVNSPDSNPEYDNEVVERETIDEVFILSASEMEKYFDSDEARRCYATPYALYYGAVVNMTTKTTFYWTRTQGSTINNIVSVDSSGELFYPGSVKTSLRRAVRPAIWIDITDFVDKEHNDPGYEDIEIPEENRGDYIE